MQNPFKRSPWGQLDWFELQLCPDQFRLALLPDQPVVVGFATPTEAFPEPTTLLISPKTNPRQVEHIRETLDGLIEKYRVFQVPPQEPQQAFQDFPMSLPSVHMRVGYGTRRWASFYAKGDLPESLQGFVASCYGLATMTAKSSSGKSISGTEALQQLDPGRDS